MKHLLLLFILFSLAAHAQNNDTIVLDEVALHKKIKLKTHKVKLRSGMLLAEPLTAIAQIVTLVDGVPAGWLKEPANTRQT
ncbi:hypothetical protein AM493_16515 [Flavobacterium akiainvivens]|uniref:Uncharacterized protein n=1 Tax=Flavobacterium akiainvivens TaxID=1202724 RepID=A0A0M9VJ89_9FLAO|nr:hypothetical protein [Flavobacterium akiainvivens]KOS07469.1 hypothetical protein AM493_16515 [Flavobacterium akiainvivens]SFQ63269.1 hypothetical protein SAMN05444144_11130 [Flavobacterium akiainvivens]